MSAAVDTGGRDWAWAACCRGRPALDCTQALRAARFLELYRPPRRFADRLPFSTELVTRTRSVGAHQIRAVPAGEDSSAEARRWPADSKLNYRSDCSGAVLALEATADAQTDRWMSVRDGRAVIGRNFRRQSGFPTGCRCRAIGCLGSHVKTDGLVNMRSTSPFSTAEKVVLKSRNRASKVLLTTRCGEGWVAPRRVA